jgi:hypothetical protein
MKLEMGIEKAGELQAYQNISSLDCNDLSMGWHMTQG